MSFKTPNFILSPLKSPIFPFSSHVTPKTLCAAIWGGGPGGPEFEKPIEANECFVAVGSATVPTASLEDRSDHFLRRNDL